MAAGCSCGTAPLALSRTPEGYVQRSSFTHPDLHDELVEEFISPRSPLAAPASTSGVAAFTFLLLGDQNAGKSTFLHAFTHATDASWLELTSLLPILSASFTNAQFVDRQQMDEPPFLDTDVGRASLLLTLEDFSFFIDEFDLPIKHEQLSQLASDGVRYAAIELIEIGGDHLDRMMALTRTNHHPPPLHAATQQPPPSLALALRRSEQLVRSSHRTIYFLNAATLLHTDASTTQSDELPRLRISSPAFWQLARRLKYLSKILPAGQRVRFHLCRVPSRHAPFDRSDANAVVASLLDGVDPSPLVERATARAASRRAACTSRTDEQAELHPEINLHAPPPEAIELLCALLPELLLHAAASGMDNAAAADKAVVEPLSLRLEDVDIASHVHPATGSGPHNNQRTLNVPSIVTTLARLFDAECLHRPPPPPSETATLAAATHLLNCFKQVSYRLHSDDVQVEEEEGVMSIVSGKRKQGEDEPSSRRTMSFEPWVSLSTWESYLSDEPENLELPVNSLASSFLPLVHRLSKSRLAISHYARGHADLSLLVQLPLDDAGAAPMAWRACGGEAAMEEEEEDQEEPVAVRFPYYPPLLDVVEAQLASGLPVEWWLGRDGLNDEDEDDEEAEAMKTLPSVDAGSLAMAEEGLRGRLQEQLLLHVRAGSAHSWSVFVWLLEEWCLANELLGRVESPFKLELQATEAVWRGALLGQHLQKAAAEGREASWRVELTILEVADGESCVLCD